MPETGPNGRITFLSHAPTEAVKRGSFPLNEAIDENESAKLAAIGWISPRLSHVQTGPEQRTRQTAAALGLDATAAEDLRDINYGSWTGMSLEEIQAQDPAGLGEWLADVHAAPHHGESIAELISRTNRWMSQHKSSGHILAVTHPTFIRAAIVLALDAPSLSFWRVEIAPLTLTDLRWSGREWKLRSAGVKLTRGQA
jgi:broad specificity phosphatase PhoE